MSLLDVVRTAIANTFRSKLRTTLTIIAIFIGAFTLTITTAIGTGISSYIDNQVASIGATDVLTISKSPDAAVNPDEGPALYDPEAATSATGFPGGSALAPSVLTGTDIDSITTTEGIVDANAVVIVAPSYITRGGGDKFELSANPTAAFTQADLAAGDQLATSMSTNEVLLPGSYLDALGLGNADDAIGQIVTIGIPDYLGEMHEVDATVVGVQNEPLFSSGAAFGQHLTDKLVEVQNTGQPTNQPEGYLAAVAHIDPDVTPEQIDTIQADLAEQGFTAQTVADQIGTIQTVINGIIGVLNAFAVIALIAAGFGIINTLLMSVQERTREIGLMKAMGMNNGKVFALFSAEAAFIGFLGSALGALVAIGVGTLISDVLATTLLADLEGLQVLQFAPASIVTIILVVMFIAFLAGTLPAHRASRQNAIDTLRYE